MGHHRSSSSRPMLRFILSWLVKLFNLPSLILTACFWYSRVLTTGISVPAHAIDTLVRLVIFSVRLAQRGRAGEWYMVSAVVSATDFIWSLCARLEWVSEGRLLLGVRRRRTTKGERASAREDVKLTRLMSAGASDTASDDIDPRLTSHPLGRSRSSHRLFFPSQASFRASVHQADPSRADLYHTNLCHRAPFNLPDIRSPFRCLPTISQPPSLRLWRQLSGRCLSRAHLGRPDRSPCHSQWLVGSVGDDT
jgi:hypothetical protein